MAASADLLILPSGLPRQEPIAPVGLSGPDSVPDGSRGTAETPLTSEPPLADTAPLTSEPPLAAGLPLTSEPIGVGYDAESAGI